MKSKNIDRIAKSVVSKIKEERTNAIKKKKTQLTEVGEAYDTNNDIRWNDQNDDVSKKIRNLLFRLLEFNNKLDIHIGESNLTISTHNIGKLRKGTNTSQSSSKYVEGDFFNIEILKERGFIINYDDKRIFYTDLTLYSNMIDEVKKSFNKSNEDNFSEFYDNMMKESGLIRDSNLDEIFTKS